MGWLGAACAAISAIWRALRAAQARPLDDLDPRQARRRAIARHLDRG